MTLKYVLTEYNNFAIFSETATHSDVARQMYGKPISAGFCFIKSEDNKVSIKCFGESISLKLKSRPEDSEIITNKIND